MLHHRSLFALILGLGFLAGCTGHNGTASGVLPQADARGAMAFGGGGVPLGPMTVLAPVDLQVAAISTFLLTNPEQCFGLSGNDDAEGDSAAHHWQHGEHRHKGNGDAAQQFGTPFTPADPLTLSLGAFTLSNPCAGKHTRGDDAASRHLQAIVPVPTGSGAHIVAQDSADSTHALIDIDGPASDDGVTYTFGVLHFGRPLRAGHTYTFALAVPATPTPAPTATPNGHGDDD